MCSCSKNSTAKPAAAPAQVPAPAPVPAPAAAPSAGQTQTFALERNGRVMSFGSDLERRAELRRGGGTAL